MRGSPELFWRTPASWALGALDEPEALLSDHAHCELGAAATCQGLIARHPTQAAFVDRLSKLAIEELRHFREVTRALRRRGGELSPPPGNPYVADLTRAAAPTRRSALLDRLLVAALIEARSHERFELLAEHAPDELASLYRALGPSEEAHGRLFVDLALELFADAEVDERLDALVLVEAEVARAQPFAPRVHAGPPHATPAGSR